MGKLHKKRQRSRLVVAAGFILGLGAFTPADALPYAGAGPYSPSGDVSGSTSVPATDSRIVEWASSVIGYQPGPVDIASPTGPKPTYNDPTLALGPADCTSSNPYNVVSLGDTGSITLGFAKPIVAGNGPDFAVYTNKFKIADGVANDYFLELAYVAVSSDGVNFFTFPSVSVTPTTTQVSGFGALDPTNIYDLAGKDIAGYGTPFSLRELAGVSPLLNINHIVAVRITDVIGNIDPGHAAVSRDSKGNIINAPYPTPYASSGFSLDAVAVLNDTVPSSDTPTMPPLALVLMAALLFLFARTRLATAASGGPGRDKGFTLVELLVTIAIISLLVALSSAAVGRAITEGKIAVSMTNLRQLAVANLSYTNDHDGYFCPAQDKYNLVRWHGVRTSVSSPYDSSKGFLTPYLGSDGRVKVCPLLTGYVTGFEDSAGGYGYNETYIGGTPADPYQPNRTQRVPNPAQTIMFTTTALAKSNGIQEYPFSEPPEWVDSEGHLAGPLQPSVHFRADGRALVAWCDGHVTAELPSQLGGSDYYGGDSAKDKIGTFGPADNNGYWNPAYGR